MMNDKGFTVVELVVCVLGLSLGLVAIGGLYAIVHFVAKIW